MTLARLLSYTGLLKRRGLDCTTCTQDQKRDRGCGKRPQIGHVSPKRGWVAGKPDGFGGSVTEWRPSWVRRQCKRTNTQHSGTEAAAWYRHADLGEAQRHTGSFWPCCPAWYAYLGGTPHAMSLADAARTAAVDAHSRPFGIGLELGSADPTPRFADLLRLCVDVLQEQQSKAEARAYEEARKNARKGRR